MTVAAFAQEANDMTHALLKHISTTCVAMQVFSLEVKKIYLNPKKRKQGWVQ